MKSAAKTLCILLAVLTMSSVILFSAKTAESTENPIRIEIALDKTRYFVSDNVKAAVTVRNTGEKDLQNLIVCVHSDKHQLLFGNRSVFEIAALGSAKSETVYLEMALNRNASGLTLLNRIILFFTQLHKNYVPFADEYDYNKDSVSESIRFKHGSISADLNATVWYEVVSETTGVSDIIDQPSTPDNPDNPPRPQVTYLDRYVVDILANGTYTVQTEIREEEIPVQVTMYVDGDNRAMEIPVSSMMAQSIGLPASPGNVGKVRVIVKDVDSNPKAYVAFPSGYIEMDDTQSALELFNKKGSIPDSLQQLPDNHLQYHGKSIGLGYVCETYILPDENIEYNFYFTQTTDYEGLVRWDVIDLNTDQVNSQTVMRLHDRVTDRNAFTVSGRKIDSSELEGLFGG